MELRVQRVNNQGTFFTVERNVIGLTQRREIFIRNGSGADCGWRVSTLAPGSRHLYLAYGWDEAQVEFRSFSCGWSNNLYELDERSSRINYTVAGEEAFNGFFQAAGLAWQDYQTALNLADCTIETIAENPFGVIRLFNNPGQGQFRLASTTDEFPPIDDVIVYDLNGRLILRQEFDAANPSQPFDISQVPNGVYIIVVRNQRWKKGFQYVKT